MALAVYVIDCIRNDPIMCKTLPRRERHIESSASTKFHKSLMEISSRPVNCRVDRLEWEVRVLSHRFPLPKKNLYHSRPALNKVQYSMSCNTPTSLRVDEEKMYLLHQKVSESNC